ncbi:unnamed protein product [marine sediment metagenome]|uniref:Uncharacterized protein n=1 Tax=marine sediment metagenome TaxID=412755 RepID=X0YZM2_9ZZZZ
MKIDGVGKLLAKDVASYKADEDYELVMTPDSPTSVLYCFDIWGSEYQFWVIKDIQKTILTKVAWSLEIPKISPQHEKGEGYLSGWMRRLLD